MALPVRAPSAAAILLLVAAGACALRLSAFVGVGGVLGAPSGYDDGVYFSSSALFTRGLLPYRDFVFVHPPGILYAFAPVSWWPDPAAGFSAGRVLCALLGGASALLAGTIVLRLAGAVPAVAAAVLYATYPDALVAEQSTFIEPVLNVLVLASALLWLDERRPFTGRRAAAAGALCGAACLAKLWGGIWLVSALAAPPRERRAIAHFVAAAAATGVVFVAPLALPAFPAFLEQTLSFQLARPPDGAMSWSARLGEMAGSDHRAATLLSLVALGSIAARLARGRFERVSRGERYFAAAMLITVLGLLAAPTYWRHYNAHLAASQCVLAGFGVAAVLRTAWPARALATAAVAAAIVALDYGSLPRALQHSRARSPELLAAREGLRSLAPAGGSVFVFDPAWGLAAGLLPEHGDTAPVIPDSYAVMLLDAVRAGRTFEETGAAFESGAPQPTIRARLAASEAVMLGWRGTWQLNEMDGAWFASRFECRNPDAGELCVWGRRAVPAREGPPLEEQYIQFREGWYGTEGVPPHTWRWMSERAAVHLPGRRGAMRLGLQLEVPLTELGRAPAISIELDGVELDRVHPETPLMERTYQIDADSGSPHVLVIRSDATFSPASRGTSGDSRALALKLTALSWTRIETRESPGAR